MIARNLFASLKALALALVSGLLLAGTAAADNKTKPNPNPNPTPAPNKGVAKREMDKNERMIDGKIVQELKQIEGLLKQVKHDYDGHRAKALAEVGTAIRDLEQHARRTTTPAPKEPAAKKDDKKKEDSKTSKEDDADKEKQAASDAQMKQALAGLLTVEKQLADYHQTKGYTALTKAVTEVETALKAR